MIYHLATAIPKIKDVGNLLICMKHICVLLAPYVYYMFSYFKLSFGDGVATYWDNSCSLGLLYVLVLVPDALFDFPTSVFWIVISF